MSHYKGLLKEVLLETYQNAAGVISCPVELAPKPGQYIQAYSSDPLEVVPTSLFAAGSPAIENGVATFAVAGPLFESWQPGTELMLRGPLGNGFHLPKKVKRIALVSLHTGPSRLMSLAYEALERGTEITLLCSESATGLPLGIEVQRLEALPRALSWADYVAISVPIEQMDSLATMFERPNIPRKLNVGVLIAAPMPCGGLAHCGVCSVETRRGIRFPCADGPVFSLNQLIAPVN